ncbi:MAG TPA: DUF6144 family protein [Lachnospiraceae bacterium]|nr:DUF6144 family protein [Lachnospiraceae bacterium]
MFDIRKIQEQVIYNVVERYSESETAQEILYGKENAAKDENNCDWVNSTMSRLESKFDEATVKQIRMDCQCGYGMEERLKLLNELKALFSSMEELANSDKAKAAGLFYENNTLYLQFPFCPCPMMSEVDKLKSKTWCQCSVGYSKVLFEKVFNCIVDVELLKSIKAGDDICLMKIVPQDSDWPMYK